MRKMKSVGGLQVEEKLHASEAYYRLPEQRLHKLEDGKISGNIIRDATGERRHAHRRGLRRRMGTATLAVLRGGFAICVHGVGGGAHPRTEWQ